MNSDTEKGIFPLFAGFATLTGLAYSIHWMFPFFTELFNPGTYAYVPFRYGFSPNSDNYAYYSYVRNVLDYGIGTFNPFDFENRKQVGPGLSYQISFFLGSLWGHLFPATQAIYSFNYFFFPFSQMLLGCYLLMVIGVNRYLSVLACAMAIFLGMFWLPPNIFSSVPLFLTGAFDGAVNNLSFTQVARTPNILITNTHLLALALASAHYFIKERRGYLIKAMLFVLLASSTLVSTANMLLSFAGFSLCYLFMYRDVSLREIATIFIPSLLCSFFGLWVLFGVVRPHVENMLEFTRLPPEILTGMQWGSFSKVLIVLLIPLLFLAFMKAQNLRFIMAWLGGAISIFALVTLFQGSLFGDKTINRGSEILMSMLVLGCLFSILFQTRSFARGQAVAVTLSLALFFTATSNQVIRATELSDHFSDPEFSGLVNWSLEQPKADGVILTLDFDVLVNFPAYTPFYMYIPQIFVSSTSPDEIYRRFLETARFYGLTVKDVGDLLREMEPHGAVTPDDPQRRNAGLMQLALYYGKHYNSPGPPEEIARLQSTYIAVLGEPYSLSFKADYLVVSEMDSRLVKPGSRAKRLMDTSEPVFRNGSYRVYSINK